MMFSNGASDTTLAEKMKPYKHYVVPVNDSYDENLLEHLGGALKFIKEGLDGGGGVLVHWYVATHPVFVRIFGLFQNF